MKSTDIIKASTNSLNIYSFTAEALERLIEAVKAEQSCKTCEALARTVMLGQTSHDTTPPQRKPLTDEQKIAEALRRHGLTLVKTAAGYDVLKLGQISAHGIKEDA